MIDIIIGIAVILFCLVVTSLFVFYSTGQINKIARMKRSTYRDILQSRHG